MFKKVFKAVCIILMAAAFLGLFGAAGASDMETWPLMRIVQQMAVCIGVMVVAAIGLKVAE